VGANSESEPDDPALGNVSSPIEKGLKGLLQGLKLLLKGLNRLLKGLKGFYIEFSS